MTDTARPDLDLTISRIIQAPRPVVWKRLDRPAELEQWWVPAPARCRVVEMELRPGGAFITQISEDGGDSSPTSAAASSPSTNSNGSSSPTRWSAAGGPPNSRS